MTYDEIIQQVGKRINVAIYCTKDGVTTRVSDDSIEKTKLINKSDLLGTYIHKCELTLKEEIQGTVSVQIQARYNTYTQTKAYGPFYILKEPEYDANKKTYEYELYDEFVKAMVDYEPLEVTYPISVYNYFSSLVTELGYTNNVSSLPNGSRIIQSELYNDIGYTYRDVLDDIAVANGVLFQINNNTISVVQRGTNTINIDDDILKNANINFGEHYGPINSIVLSRGGESDNVFQKDDASISQNGLHEFKIVDNQLMRENDRSDYLSALATQLFGIEYDIYDTELVGYGEIDALDEVVFETGDNTYTSYVFNDEVTITSGYKQVIYCETPIQSETDYKSASKTDKTINQAYIITRKNTAEIEELARKVVDVSAEKTSVGSLQLENAYEGILHKLTIKGSFRQLFPKDDEYPKSTLYPLSSILMVDDTEYEIRLTHLNYLSSTVYDEFNYLDGKAWVDRKVGINQDGTLYELPTPVKEDLGEVYLEVKNNSIIKMKSFNNLTYYTEYLLENNYTSTFANQVEVKSSLELLGDKIEASVSSVADGEGKITSASIILALNTDESTAEINADKINLNGVVTANEHFKIHEDGTMECQDGIFNGTIKGGKVEIDGAYSKESPYIRVKGATTTDPTDLHETRIWGEGIVVYNYPGIEDPSDSYAEIRTEIDGGYAELRDDQVNAFGFNNVSLASNKENIVKYQKNALELIKDIDIYNYTYKGQRSEKRRLGVVIGDDYKYCEEITNEKNNSIDLYSFISLCCKAIQEQQEEIEELRKEIEKCKK